MRVTTSDHETPLGTMWSAWTDRGLYSLNWEQPNFETVVASPQPRSGSTCFVSAWRVLSSRTRVLLRRGHRSHWVDQVHLRSLPALSDDCSGDHLDLQATGGAGRKRASESSSWRCDVSESHSAGDSVPPRDCRRRWAARFHAPGGLATKRFLLELEREGSWPTAFSS